jgi:hypothetical protein
VRVLYVFLVWIVPLLFFVGTLAAWGLGGANGFVCAALLFAFGFGGALHRAQARVKDFVE